MGHTHLNLEVELGYSHLLSNMEIASSTHYDARMSMGPFVTTNAGGVEYDYLRDYSHKYFHCHLNWSHQDKLYRTK